MKSELWSKIYLMEEPGMKIEEEIVSPVLESGAKYASEYLQEVNFAAINPKNYSQLGQGRWEYKGTDPGQPGFVIDISVEKPFIGDEEPVVKIKLSLEKQPKVKGRDYAIESVEIVRSFKGGEVSEHSEVKVLTDEVFGTSRGTLIMDQGDAMPFLVQPEKGYLVKAITNRTKFTGKTNTSNMAFVAKMLGAKNPRELASNSVRLAFRNLPLVSPGHPSF